MSESPEEKEALEKLDEATREVGWDELQKEADREVSTSIVGRLGLGLGLGVARYGRFRLFRRSKGDPVPEPVDDSDPGNERGLRDVLHEDDKKS